jgi:hypothetical protein
MFDNFIDFRRRLTSFASSKTARYYVIFYRDILMGKIQQGSLEIEYTPSDIVNKNIMLLSHLFM